LRALAPLDHLQYLNLVGTAVTLQGVLQLKNLQSLHSLYLYQTKVNGNDWSSARNAFPKARIDSGGYLIEKLVTDTMMVKVKKEY
jgi:hypothetical protein